MTHRLPEPESLAQEFHSHLEKAASPEQLEALRLTWLGRKEGRLTSLMKTLGTLPLEQKRLWGPRYNQLKADVQSALEEKTRSLSAAQRALALDQDTLDISLPGTPAPVGRLHPLLQVIESLVSIFRGMGFVCADGPEIESEYFNFDALNVPANHPARDMQDTFYLENARRQLTLPDFQDPAARFEPVLLRTHTSPVQVHVLQKYPPPVAIIAPGRVYRHEAQDATHLATFHQLEGLMVDSRLSMADLKGTLARFAQLFFAPHVRTRFKPSFFPFTEPSAQMDVSCWLCDGSGCRTCGQMGWIELLGAGMVNPRVFEMAGLDPEKTSGFAFGMGIERLAMLKYGIEDLRTFYENDVRFLEQF